MRASWRLTKHLRSAEGLAAAKLVCSVEIRRQEACTKLSSACPSVCPADASLLTVFGSVREPDFSSGTHFSDLLNGDTFWFYVIHALWHYIIHTNQEVVSLQRTFSLQK